MRSCLSIGTSRCQESRCRVARALLTRKIGPGRIRCGETPTNASQRLRSAASGPIIVASNQNPVGEAKKAEVTQLLARWSVGDSTALDRLMQAVYGELRRMAARYLRKERPQHTLQPTALVHEAFIRLIDQHDVRWQ